MSDSINRRSFIKTGAAGAMAAAVVQGAGPQAAAQSTRSVRPNDDRKVRLGFIGTGRQGRNLLRTSLAMSDVEVPAVCDIEPDALAQAKKMVEDAGRAAATGYGDGEEAYLQLVERGDLDGIIIATPWEWHVPMAIATMKAGKYACVEVPVATTIEECWDLVNTSEQTGMPCMMLENHSFQDDNLAVLNMVRLGMFGEIVHGECGYQHDVRFPYKIEADGSLGWRGRHSVVRNGDLYPTHGLGPVAQFLDINCGNRFVSITSTASKSRGIKHFIGRRWGADHPNARREYALGDIVTSVLKTARGETIIVIHDTNLPRPYSNMTTVAGTRGLYKEFSRALKYVHFEHDDPMARGGDRWEDFAPYQDKYRHKLWKEFQEIASGFGHGGTDYLKVRSFLDAVKERGPVSVDVYDAVAWSVVSPLSEASIAAGSAPQMFPDFTRGRWVNRKPFFAIDMT